MLVVIGETCTTLNSVFKCSSNDSNSPVSNTVMIIEHTCYTNAVHMLYTCYIATCCTDAVHMLYTWLPSVNGNALLMPVSRALSILASS